MITVQEIKKEYVKCYRDRTRKYFIEHYLSTFNANERKTVPFKLFPRQIEFLNSLCYNPNTIAVKHRQAGITTVSAAWITGQIVFAKENSPETVLCIGNNLEIAQQLLTKISDFLLQVPRFFWGSDFYSPDPKSEKNQKSIFVVKNTKELVLFNKCRVVARSSGENAARGVSAASIVIFDEAAFIENGTTVYSQAVATTASVSNAKVIMVSTPNGKDRLYYRTYKNALEGKNNYTPVEFKWFQDPRYNRNLRWYKKDEETGEYRWDNDVPIDEDGNIVYDEERWRNLERSGWTPTSPWYEEMCKTFNNDDMKIAQELNVSFLGSSDNVIPTDVIEFHRDNNVILIDENWKLQDPLFTETWIWKEPIKGHRYVCSVDGSSGSGEDRTAIEIIDIDANDGGFPYFEQVLEYNGKLTGDDVAELVFSYATAYNNALVIVECIGGYGDAIVLALMRMKYKNLYYDDTELKNYMVQKKYSELNIQEGEKLPGFRTSSVRVQMISNFIVLLKNNGFRPHSIRMIGEMETWIFKGAAKRIDHMDGCHDDTLTCTAMALFVIQYSIVKMERSKETDATILSSFIVNRISSGERPKLRDGQPISSTSKKMALPIYGVRGFAPNKNSVYNKYAWLAR